MQSRVCSLDVLVPSGSVTCPVPPCSSCSSTLQPGWCWQPKAQPGAEFRGGIWSWCSVQHTWCLCHRLDLIAIHARCGSDESCCVYDSLSLNVSGSRANIPPKLDRSVLECVAVGIHVHPWQSVSWGGTSGLLHGALEKCRSSCSVCSLCYSEPSEFFVSEAEMWLCIRCTWKCECLQLCCSACDVRVAQAGRSDDIRGKFPTEGVIELPAQEEPPSLSLHSEPWFGWSGAVRSWVGLMISKLFSTRVNSAILLLSDEKSQSMGMWPWQGCICCSSVSRRIQSRSEAVPGVLCQAGTEGSPALMQMCSCYS